MEDQTSKKIEVNVEQKTGFPVAGIIVLAVGGYLILFAIILMIRKLCISKDQQFCPSWCAELFMCTGGCCAGPMPCCSCLEETCNCQYPNKRCFMDAICPSKQWCDDACCCCLSNEAEGKCSCFDTNDCCTCCGLNCNECCECCDCTSCKECVKDCKCTCCAQPETCDCCCFEIKLNSTSAQARREASIHGGGGYMNDGYMNAGVGAGGVVMNQPPFNQSRYDNQQLGYNNQSTGPFRQQSGYGQQQQQQVGTSGRFAPSGNYNNQQQQPASSYGRANMNAMFGAS